METKMTAVEWLFKQLWEEPKDKMVWYAILDKAKEMEREQITKAYDSGGDHYTDFGAPIWGIDYYNETYKK